jgi:hypothetical protein
MSQRSGRLDFLVEVPFLFVVTGKRSKTLLRNEGFSPVRVGKDDRFYYEFPDNNAATLFRKTAIAVGVEITPIFSMPKPRPE